MASSTCHLWASSSTAQIIFSIRAAISHPSRFRSTVARFLQTGGSAVPACRVPQGVPHAVDALSSHNTPTRSLDGCLLDLSEGLEMRGALLSVYPLPKTRNRPRPALAGTPSDTLCPGSSRRDPKKALQLLKVRLRRAQVAGRGALGAGDGVSEAGDGVFSAGRGVLEAE